MRKKVCIYLIMQMFGILSFAQIKIANQYIENLENPIGLDIIKPNFSWQMVSEKRQVMQTSYEIRVSENLPSLLKGENLIWDTKKLKSDKSTHVQYDGKPLLSGKKYYWQVRVTDNYGNTSNWTAPAFWQMGLLNQSDWKCKWIEAGFKEDSILRPSPLFRKQFAVIKKVHSATANITSLGMYEAFINGKRIGNAYFTPGWTSYNKRLQYQTYDVTQLLKDGNNAVGVVLGSGWYRGYIGFTGTKDVYGKKLALLLQIDIIYTDGTSETVISDESWKSSTGPILSSEIYHGELYDSRLEKEGWTTSNFDDASWNGVKHIDHPKDKLIATYNEPVTKQEVFTPIRIFKTPLGEQVIDFGQNLVGWVQMKVNGKAGDKVIMYHAEVLDKKGNFYTENLRAAKAMDTYILKGKDKEIFEPHFTFHGFRYLKVEGYPGEIKAENFKAIALYSDMKTTGSFTTSNALLNQLQHNIQWGQNGNFIDVPTDCPQRDERLGWTGDAQAFSKTAAFNRNVNNFFAKWLKDLSADQYPDGSVPWVIPNVLGTRSGGSTGWADVATIIPWNTYISYNDKRILEDQYASMKAWVEFMHNQSKNDLWNTGFHFGDWLFYSPGDDNDGRAAVTDKYLIAQCFYAHSTQLLINTAKVLGKTEDVEKYTALLGKIKDAFLKEYITPNGRLVSGTQTAYVLALNFDMLPEGLRMPTANKLVDNIKSYRNHLTTGFLGTPYLCHVLTRFGYHDVAYQLLLQETYPSWLYPVKMGATTIWERWDGIKPDSTFQDVGMNSFNHYAYGAIGDWMYKVITGINPKEEAPGYKEIIIKPQIGGGLKFAKASLLTYYGMISSAWEIKNNSLIFDVEIPVNTTAGVYVPASSATSVNEGNTALSAAKDIQIVGSENGFVILKVGSGKYHFTISK